MGPPPVRRIPIPIPNAASSAVDRELQRIKREEGGRTEGGREEGEGQLGALCFMTCVVRQNEYGLCLCGTPPRCTAIFWSWSWREARREGRRKVCFVAGGWLGAGIKQEGGKLRSPVRTRYCKFLHFWHNKRNKRRESVNYNDYTPANCELNSSRLE